MWGMIEDSARKMFMPCLMDSCRVICKKNKHLKMPHCHSSALKTHPHQCLCFGHLHTRATSVYWLACSMTSCPQSWMVTGHARSLQRLWFCCGWRPLLHVIPPFTRHVLCHYRIRLAQLLGGMLESLAFFFTERLQLSCVVGVSWTHTTALLLGLCLWCDSVVD